LLNHNRDKEGYTQCYHQLVQRDPSSQNYALLGEAYLRILNPEAAVDALLRAHELDRGNARLRGRIGRAMVATHEYHRAVDFYEQAIREVSKAAVDANSSSSGSGKGPSSSNSAVAARAKTSEMVSLSHDLAKLYLKLGRGESSSRVLTKILHETHRDIVDMRQDVATLLLLAEVQQINSVSEVLGTLIRAKTIQKDLLTQVRSDVNMASSSDIVEKEKVALSEICEKVRTHTRQLVTAVKNYPPSLL
jgi:tetratricopeptide repeat protein 21B